jgi:glutamate dehydrogenase
MSYKFEEGKDLIIESLVEKIKQKMSGDQAIFCAEFVRQFFSTVALDDLLEWSLDDLYGAAVNFWALIQYRSANETKIRIYNPDFERHGWQTTHTVVEILSRDMPFLVDSVRMVVNRMGFASHLIIHMGGLRLMRGEHNEVTAVLPKHGEIPVGAEVDAPIFMEIDRITDHTVLDELHRQFEGALADNRAVVDDWLPMREKVKAIIDELEHIPATADSSEVEETKAFLHWIEDHHFTFLGIRDYELVHKKNETILQPIQDTGLGVLRKDVRKSGRSISAMTPEARELTLSPRILVMSKTNTLATVHRDAYTDYIGVKRFDKQGRVIGERRILGLYTSAAYNTNPKHIPFLRHKVALIMKNSLLNPRGHAGKVLLNILETFPRDDLIQASEDELLEMSMGIFYMQERRRIRMFARTDIYHRFVSCLVYVPRDRFNTELREDMQKVLRDSFGSDDIKFTTRFSESVLARIHFIIRINPEETTEYDFKEIEKKLIDVGRSWTDDLQEFLSESFGEEDAHRLYAHYKNAFPAVYMTNFSPRTGVVDIRHLEQLATGKDSLGMNFYLPLDDSENFKLKIYQKSNSTIPLSDVLPIIENLGLRALTERPYKLRFEEGKKAWINDFSLQYTLGSKIEFDEIRDLFQNAFTRIWFGQAENDGFNKLVLGAGLDWRQVSVLRAYAKYFKQIAFTFSQEYIESALNNHTAIAKKLVRLFEMRFNPNELNAQEDHFNQFVSEILTDLDNVENLDEDKIIRQYVQVITSTLRTNYYQVDKNGQPKSYISIKLNSKTIPGVPRPYPMFEIFVYSPTFEGVHLRCAKVARGGLRWSDRKEDFRTEILGLMKAQQVKNAVIVPSGAKGGFVPKYLPLNGTREEIQNEAILCYQSFIRGLLDITDNYKEGEVVKPERVICYDGDDPYLVVAADKGTATFSDIANEISLEYGFWLGDAFASGGSMGYDHKKMGITAKGAWESVKRHFYEMNFDIETTDFTVVGIGDMAGDVFGNGMLLSQHIKLVGAFNHVHIFIDPDPDPESSFIERQRLFNLPRSAWSDYDKKLISKGGGVFNRNAKSISVSKEMKQLFGIKQAVIEPSELIKIMLTASVDLLWSAGIGTFVKAQSESNTDVGDRTNDVIRINAKQLQCKVIGEGGNLGLTQLARVEYALNGGLIYTDFIDNSAGVSCSDKEVNIKIMLEIIIAAGDLTAKQRNQLLSQMTDDVSRLVLSENHQQTRAISLIAWQALRSVELHRRYINELERLGKLDRHLEFLPEEKVLMERKMLGKGLTSPDIAVLFCYSKIQLKEAILASDVPEDPFLNQFMLGSLPKALSGKFNKQLPQHPLRREIIATKLSNIIVNEMGFTFVYRLQDETGAPVSAVVRAYMIARTILDMDPIWSEIEALGSKIDSQKQNEMMMTYMRLLRRTARWFIRNQRTRLDIAKNVKLYEPGLTDLKKSMPGIFTEGNLTEYNEIYNQYQQFGVSEKLAHELTITRGLFAALDIIEVARQLDLGIPTVAEIYFNIGEFLELAWIRTQIIIHPTENHWEALSREALRDDLDWQQRQLTAGIIQYDPKKHDLFKYFDAWAESHAGLIERWRHVLSNLRSTSALNYTMFFVAIRELLDLTQTTMQTTENKQALQEA